MKYMNMKKLSTNSIVENAKVIVKSSAKKLATVGSGLIGTKFLVKGTSANQLTPTPTAIPTAMPTPFPNITPTPISFETQNITHEVVGNLTPEMYAFFACLAIGSGAVVYIFYQTGKSIYNNHIKTLEKDNEEMKK